MKILFLSPFNCVPANTGNKILTNGLLQFLSNRHDCDLVLLTDPGESTERTTESLRNSFPGLSSIQVFDKPAGSRLLQARLRAGMRGEHPAFGRYRNRALLTSLRRMVASQDYDVVHIDMMLMAQYAEVCRPLPRVLMASDAYSSAARRARNEAAGVRCTATAMVLEGVFGRYERTQYPRLEAVATVSDADRDYLQARCPGATVMHVGLPLPERYQRLPIRAFATDPQATPRILVTGAISHCAVERTTAEFLRGAVEYAPARPDAVVVLGASPRSGLARLMREASHVTHVSFVDDYDGFLQHDWVYVYPQRTGSGLQTKVQQAMALGLPVVGYDIAFGGLAVQDEVHAFVCQTDADLHSAVRRLLTDSDLRGRVGTAAANHVRQRFSIGVVGAEMEQVYARARQNVHGGQFWPASC